MWVLEIIGVTICAIGLIFLIALGAEWKCSKVRRVRKDCVDFARARRGLAT